VCSVDLISRECERQVVLGLRGELDVAVAVRVVAELSVVAACERDIIVDLAGLEFIDSSGLAALVRVRERARLAGGDLLLAAPQGQVLRLLSLTRLIDIFSVHASVDEAARDARRSRRAGVTVGDPRPSSPLAELGRGRSPEPGRKGLGLSQLDRAVAGPLPAACPARGLGNLLSGHWLARARPGVQGARYATSGTGAPALGQAPRK